MSHLPHKRIEPDNKGGFLFVVVRLSRRAEFPGFHFEIEVLNDFGNGENLSHHEPLLSLRTNSTTFK